ncbi:MAG TPA: hypothetical protein VF389_09210, partial [Woeseiaceae bacterium]
MSAGSLLSHETDTGQGPVEPALKEAYELTPGQSESITLKPYLHLLGDMRIVHGSTGRPLPQSRKTRGLLAYLALVERRVRRDELCDLLWDSPDDPRAALRWSLSKLRPLLNVNDQTALQADRDFVALDHDLVRVDVREIRAL